MANACVHASDGGDSDSDGGQGGRGGQTAKHWGNSAFAVQKTAKRPGKWCFLMEKWGEGVRTDFVGTQLKGGAACAVQWAIKRCV